MNTSLGMHAKMSQDNSGRGTKSVTHTLEETLNGQRLCLMNINDLMNIYQMLIRLLLLYFTMSWVVRTVLMPLGTL